MSRIGRVAVVQIDGFGRYSKERCGRAESEGIGLKGSVEALSTTSWTPKSVSMEDEFPPEEEK